MKIIFILKIYQITQYRKQKKSQKVYLYDILFIKKFASIMEKLYQFVPDVIQNSEYLHLFALIHIKKLIQLLKIYKIKILSIQDQIYTFLFLKKDQPDKKYQKSNIKVLLMIQIYLQKILKAQLHYLSFKKYFLVLDKPHLAL